MTLFWFDVSGSYASLIGLSVTDWKRHKGDELKPGFHYPSWRPELTARVDGWSVSITRQHNMYWRARVSISRVDGPLTRTVNSGSGNRASLATDFAVYAEIFIFFF